MPGPLEALKQYATDLWAQGAERRRDPWSAIPTREDLERGDLKGLSGGGLAGTTSLVKGAIQPLSAGANVMAQKMGAQARPVFEGLKKAGAFAGDRTVGNIRQAVVPSAEFAAATPAAEAAFNATRPVQRFTNPLEAVYEKLRAQGGRALDETGRLAMSPIEGLIGAGALGGLAYYGGQLANKIRGAGQQVNEAVNPFDRYADILTEEERKRLGGGQ